MVCVKNNAKIQWYNKTMSQKHKKKRNKRYQGADAAMTKPTVTRVSAANRNKVEQWWFDNKRVVKPVMIAAAIVLAIIWLVYELIRIANG